MKLLKIYEDISGTLNEKVLNIDDAVDYVYKTGGFAEVVREFKAGMYPYKREIVGSKDILFGTIDSSALPGDDAKRAHEAKPITIYCGIVREHRNSYLPRENKISVSFNYDALYCFYTDCYRGLPTDQKLRIEHEITEYRIKASISHELSHWISDSTHNFHLSKILSAAREMGTTDAKILGQHDVNMTYFEIDAFIHGIAQMKRQFSKDWDDFTLSDLFNRYTTLNAINNRLLRNYGVEVNKVWRKYLLKRMARENLVGDNMKYE